MNYKELTSLVFESLKGGDSINARQLLLDTRTDTDIYIFRNSTGSHSCLLESSSLNHKLPEIRGINIRYETFGKPDEEKVPFINLECTRSIYNNNFVLIIREILEDYDKGEDDISKSVIRVINKWKHFMAEPENDLMSEEDIIGLTGELLLLLKLAEDGGTDFVRIWTADSGEEDFICADRIVEVKSSLKDNHVHFINGINQLLTPDGIVKYILSVLLKKSHEESTRITIPSLVNKISVLLTESPDDETLFWQKLRKRGYDPRDAEAYDEFGYILYKGCYFEVDDSFPRLTTNELREPLSPRISKIRYQLDLEGLPCLDFRDTHTNTIFQCNTTDTI